jgi:hypothetical protein
MGGLVVLRSAARANRESQPLAGRRQCQTGPMGFRS